MSKWISVKDRLPVLDWTYYLVAVCPKLSTNEVHYALWTNEQFKVLNERGNHKDFITHWMPLPDPPTKAID